MPDSRLRPLCVFNLPQFNFLAKRCPTETHPHHPAPPLPCAPNDRKLHAIVESCTRTANSCCTCPPDVGPSLVWAQCRATLNLHPICKIIPALNANSIATVSRARKYRSMLMRGILSEVNPVCIVAAYLFVQYHRTRTYFPLRCLLRLVAFAFKGALLGFP